MLFLVSGVAHNHMNFGNYLFGAGGHALGIGGNTLKFGAHYNSLFNSSTNGYVGQFDSFDDQFSIEQGILRSIVLDYRNKTWSPTGGLVKRSR